MMSTSPYPKIGKKDGIISEGGCRMQIETKKSDSKVTFVHSKARDDNL